MFSLFQDTANSAHLTIIRRHFVLGLGHHMLNATQGRLVPDVDDGATSPRRAI